jgi:hypothetical protein
VQTLLAEWREADKAAYEAEHVIFEATMRYTKEQGPRPSDEELDHAKELRHQASELFKRVMDKFGQPATGHAPLS